MSKRSFCDMREIRYKEVGEVAPPNAGLMARAQGLRESTRAASRNNGARAAHDGGNGSMAVHRYRGL
jgi:hypothetical protein